MTTSLERINELVKNQHLDNIAYVIRAKAVEVAVTVDGTCGWNHSSSEEYKAWITSHIATCQINHATSSEDREAPAAVEMFGRSVGNLQLKCTTFVGDGDSSRFGRVKRAP